MEVVTRGVRVEWTYLFVGVGLTDICEKIDNREKTAPTDLDFPRLAAVDRRINFPTFPQQH